MSRRGLPVNGALVTFRLAEEGGALEPASALTDADGRARTSWTLGGFPGSQSLIATVQHLDSKWKFLDKPDGTCDVEFNVDYRFKRRAIQFLFTGTFYQFNPDTHLFIGNRTSLANAVLRELRFSAGIAKLPGQPFAATPLLWLLLIAAVALAAGLAGWRRRDVG